ncbi:unnamed protein product [Didymodactylos carnosus]|uniref:LITAF domain-containing protein n=1 Tax=Didymodactylos carnosus TaxID=1234261 RepID=A0A814P3N0_9BILA|nr:unnamed protein product [Didymodactylos carnosus]CAF1612996.1 unnamed protein product [Didymodactylos carnosus]CAF3864537.1 unnamed protein product [Didymodactylos carnosus]CAF4428110.1 unnamed protein product [Didymodactylos carnosus]
MSKVEPAYVHTLPPQPVMVSGWAPPLLFGEYPQQCTCINCRQNIVTRVEKSVGCQTWLICGLLIFIGFFFPPIWLGFCFIPFCCNSTKDTQHYCPACATLLGAHKK